jgi:hypothetical protein
MTLWAAAIAAALLLFGATPVQAQPVPDGAVELYLKDHPDLPLAAVDGGARLTSIGDSWEIEGDEALQNLCRFQIVHHESRQCLAADTSGGGASAPVSLIDCADAHAWEVFYHNPGHRDFRFVAPNGYLLGLLERSDAVEGAEILAVRSAPSDSMHFHEWLMERSGVLEDTPVSSTPPPVGEAVADPASSDDPPMPSASLPITGVGLGVAAAAGGVALAGGAVLVLWWHRQRVLRSHW